MNAARRLCWLAAAVLAGALHAAEAPPGDESEAQGPIDVDIVTSYGTMTVELWPHLAPHTVANFLDLAERGFYEGLIFHRVIAGFVIQGGGYDAGMNYRSPPRKVVNESIGGAANAKGTIAMARGADPDSADSQFFINMADNSHLDARSGAAGYTVFGRLTGGQDVAEDIELAETRIDIGRPEVPLAPIFIRSVQRSGATR